VKSPQPNSRHCFVCGVSNPFGLHLRFYDTAPGEVTADITIPEQYQGYPGVVHGGIVAAMLDEVAGRTIMSNPPRFMFTARLDIRYRKNVPIGKPLRMVGNLLKSRSRMVTAKSVIYNQEGTLLAEAEALLMDVPENLLKQVDIDALGWKVYQDEEVEKK
jgi:uncharacterized protein (TIGR00369 family)